MTTIENRPSHFIELAEVKRWLGEYGLDPSDIRDIRIEIGRDYRNSGDVGVVAWLDVTFYLHDTHGARYPIGVRYAGLGGEAATGHATIPLRSFPALTPVPIPDDG